MGLSLQPPASASVMSVTSDSGEDGGQGEREDSDNLSVSDIFQLDGAAASGWTTTSDESDEDMDQNDDEDEHSEDEGNITESEADIDESEDEEDKSDTHTDDTESENEAEPSDDEGDEGDDESDCNNTDVIPAWYDQYNPGTETREPVLTRIVANDRLATSSQLPTIAVTNIRLLAPKARNFTEDFL